MSSGGACANMPTISSITSSPRLAPSAARHGEAFGQIATSQGGTSSRRNMPERRPVSTINAATALTNSLCQAAVEVGVKLDSHRGAVATTPQASRPASASGNTSRSSVRSRTQPSGCVSAENHTADGTTVDDGQYRPTRSTCSTPFCSAHTTVRSSHSRASQPPACLVLGVLDGQEHHVDRTVDSRDRCARGPAARSGSLLVGPDSIDRAAECPHSRTG